MPILRNSADVTGTIKYLSNTLIVNGYIPCDGSVYPIATYPSLASVIGTTYNIGGEGSSNFRVPDLRSKTPVGAGQDSAHNLSNRVLGYYGVGFDVGEETHVLVVDELAEHVHTATTGIESPLHAHPNSINYTTTNISGQDLNSHAHYYTHTNTAFDGDSGGGSTMPNGDRGATTGGSGSLNHGHTYTTSNASYSHNHQYQTDEGTGLGDSHNNMQPSLVCCFYIKY
jgi:microcystin-dependent protein